VRVVGGAEVTRVGNLELVIIDCGLLPYVFRVF
jgi:hypothetical protein